MNSKGDSNAASAPAGGIEASVLVPILNEAGVIEETLPLMLDQRFDGDMEFLLLDGGSTDGTLDILRSWQARDDRIQILDNPRQNQSAGLNLGLSAARGKYIVRMDAHTYYPSDYVSTGVGRIRRGDVAWVAGPAVAVGNDPWTERIALALSSKLGTGGAKFRLAHEEEFEADAGFTGVLRAETLRRLGGWDEDWLVNEDKDLAARVYGEGGRIVCVPQMAAEYIPRGSVAGLARQYWRFGFWGARTWKRHRQSRRPSHLLSVGLLLAVLGAVLAPGPLRRICRGGVALYAAATGLESARLSPRSPRDAALLPLAFAAIHLSWGAGFVIGALRSLADRR